MAQGVLVKESGMRKNAIFITILTDLKLHNSSLRVVQLNSEVLSGAEDLLDEYEINTKL